MAPVRRAIDPGVGSDRYESLEVDLVVKALSGRGQELVPKIFTPQRFEEKEHERDVAGTKEVLEEEDVLDHPDLLLSRVRPQEQELSQPRDLTVLLLADRPGPEIHGP